MNAVPLGKICCMASVADARQVCTGVRSEGRLDAVKLSAFMAAVAASRLQG